MNLGDRCVLMAVLPVAMTLAGCNGERERIDEPPPDSGLPDPGNPDTAPAGYALLRVTPPSVDLGCAEVGVTSNPVVVTVANAGPAVSGPLSVTVSGEGISTTGCDGTVLPPKATCTISVIAKLTKPGSISGTIEVGDTPVTTKKIAVSAICTGRPAQFTLSTNALNLDSVATGKTVSGSIVLTNTALADLSGFVIAASGTGYSLSPEGTCTDTLAKGQTCTIVVTYTAGATLGLAKGSVTVSQGGVTKTVAVNTTVLAPANLVMTPPSASLITVWGTPSTPVTFQIANTGDATSTIPVVTITGANKDDFSFNSTCAKGLTGGGTETCQVSVVYNPSRTSAVVSTATLSVAESGTDGSSASAALTGTGINCSGPSIRGTSNDFGNVIVGSSSPTLTFTITNSGGEDSGIVEISTSSPFAIVTDDCTGKSIPSKKDCTFTAQFTPTPSDVGVLQGQLKAKLGYGGCLTGVYALYDVTGTAVPQAKLTIEPKVLEFGSVPTAMESAPLTLTVANIGGAPTGALKIDKTGAEFAIKSDTCTGKALTATGASKTCTVVVTYTPAAQPSEANGSITVTDTTGAAAAPASATLHGTGIPHASLVLSPTAVCPQNAADDPLCIPSASTNRFSNMPIGQTSPEVTFVLSNMTDPSVAPDSGLLTFRLQGEAAADFAIANNSCTAPLVSTGTPPTTCTVSVTFKPSAAGLRKAVLNITTSRGGPVLATLEGKGLN